MSNSLYLPVSATGFQWREGTNDDGTPKIGNGSCVVTMHDFSKSGSYTVDFQSQAAGFRILVLAAIYIDNSRNTSNVIIGINNPINTINVPAGAQGIYPLFTNGLQQISVTNVAGLSAGMTEITWSDTDRGLNVWQSGSNQAITTVREATLDSTVTSTGGTPSNQAIRVVIDTANAGDTSMANPQQVMISPGGNALANGNPIPIGIALAGNPVATGNALPVTLSLGGNAVATANPVPTTQASATTGGSNKTKVNSVAGTNATLIAAGAHQLYGYALYNTTANVAFFHFYDKATAPVAGTDIPAFTIMVPANGSAICPIDATGIVFSLGIGYTITGAYADNDATAVVAGSCIGFIASK